MCKVLIIGNPNVGKSTLFNSITNSKEHTGNFHGVTVNSKFKKIKVDNKEFTVYDLPGIYSLNTFTAEEDVSKEEILKNDSLNLLLVDCNSLRKNLYLSLQLNELGIDYKILLNNYDFFIKKKNKIDVKKLKSKLNKEIEIINAKKCGNKKILELLKSGKKSLKNIEYLDFLIKKIKKEINVEDELIVKALNGDIKHLNEKQIEVVEKYLPEAIQVRYNYIDAILNDCVEINSTFIYGYNKFDKVFLNPFLMLSGFIIFFFLSIFIIFFKIGPFLANFLSFFINFLIINPINNVLFSLTDNIWILEFFSSGVCSSFLTVLSFLPQICLIFMFLTILEDSGIISRLAYVLDDFLSRFGLNGKAVYIILLGLGCNTVSTMATKSLNGKNLKTKSVIINPYISCFARLPIYVIIASAFFNKFAYLIIVCLYILGLFVALAICFILNKKCLKTKDGELLLEFAPLRSIDVKHVGKVCVLNAKDFLKRISGIVISVGIIIWVLTHTQFNLAYTQNINNSILFIVVDFISVLFAPIGLNSAGIVCALIVGFMAKELIVSSISVTNNVKTNAELISSLTLASSAVNFTIPSAISFLIFSSLYCSCASNLAVIKKETNTFTMWFSAISQFTVSYMLSFVVYQTLTKGWWNMFFAILIITLILFSMIYIKKKFSVKCGKNCLNCFCNKKS